MKRGAVCLAWAAVALLVPVARADQWPAWRGPTRDGLSAEPVLPLEWSPTTNIAWKTKIPGKGHSSPIVWNDAIFVTTATMESQERRLYRVNRLTGAIEWERVVLTAPLEPIHPLNSHASSTPATDGKRVYVSFLDTDQMFIAAYSLEGERLWVARPGPFSSKHGYCANPVLYQDALIVNGDHDGDAFLAMLRKDTGAIVWKTPRENRTRSYCTPILLEENGKDQLVLNGSFCTAGYDCGTGAKLWSCDGPSEQMVATLVHGHGLIFSLGGYPERHLLAIRRGGRGDVNGDIVWRTHQGIPYVPSPLLYGDYLHVVSDEGFYTCFDPPTGKTLARKRASKHVSGSLVGGQNRVYLTDDEGTTLVLANGPEYEVLATNSLGEEVYSSLAVSRGNLFARGAEHLFCIGPNPTPLVVTAETRLLSGP